MRDWTRGTMKKREELILQGHQEIAVVLHVKLDS